MSRKQLSVACRHGLRCSRPLRGSRSARSETNATRGRYLPNFQNGGDAYDKDLGSSGDRGRDRRDGGDGSEGRGAGLRPWSWLRPCGRRACGRCNRIWRIRSVRPLLRSSLLRTGTVRLLRWAVLRPSLLSPLVKRTTKTKSPGKPPGLFRIWPTTTTASDDGG